MTVLERPELEASPLADLHAIADQVGLDGFRRLRKADLIDAILGESSSAEEREAPTDGPGPEGEEGSGEPAQERVRAGSAQRVRAGVAHAVAAAAGRRAEDGGELDEGAASLEEETDSGSAAPPHTGVARSAPAPARLRAQPRTAGAPRRSPPARPHASRRGRGAGARQRLWFPARRSARAFRR